MPEIIFNGTVDIYLQGHDALEPTINNHHHMEYFIGSTASNILIRDYREAANEEARRMLKDPYETGTTFADVFSQPANVVIKKNSNAYEIEISNLTKKQAPAFVLWMGTSHDGSVEEQKSTWKIIKPITDKLIVFAALL